MKCPECNQNGISLFAKLLTFLELDCRCMKCGTLFQLNKGLYLLLNVLLEGAIIIAIVYAFANLQPIIAYIGTLLGFVAIFFLVALLPIKVKSKLRRSRLDR